MPAATTNQAYNLDSFKRQDPDAPLLICDADEVLLAFMAAFEAHLHDQDYYFDWQAFRLTGSVRRRADDEAIDQAGVHAALASFFEVHTGSLSGVPGAAQSLARLSEQMEVVILSNVPGNHAPARDRNLSNLGMNYPLIVNDGPKGPAVRTIGQLSQGQLFFIDDSPNHHKSVADLWPECHRIHFIHDDRLGDLIGQAPHSHYRAKDWSDIHDYIALQLDQTT